MNTEIPEIPPPEGTSLRYTVAQDAGELRKWLLQDEQHYSFPMDGSIAENEDAVRRWISFSRTRSSLTLEYENKPVGIATLYIQNYKRLTHQTEFGIILNKDFHGRGFGAYLLSCIMKLAKQVFHIEILHLQASAHNPAVHLYQSFGFVTFGTQERWTKNSDGSYGTRLFMERAL